MEDPDHYIEHVCEDIHPILFDIPDLSYAVSWLRFLIFWKHYSIIFPKH